MEQIKLNKKFFQTVYDQIIPIIDYTNLFIFGVTTALAWPLPDKPIDKNKLQELYENATLPDLRRDDVNIPDGPIVEPVSASNELSGENFVYDRKDAYYNKGRPAYYDYNPQKTNSMYSANDWYYNQPKHRKSSKYGYYFNKAPKERLYDQIDRIAKQPYRPWQKKSSWGRPTTSAPPPKRRPVKTGRRLVYPMLRKRSVRDVTLQSDPEERLSLHHHRSTRHALYVSIEKYLQA